MALIKIDDVDLYTGFTASAADCYAAKKWLDEQNITYTLMNYADDSQHNDLFNALNTWWPNQHTFTDFPFVIYTEIHDDLSPKNYPKVCIQGLADIQASNLPQLWKLGRS